MEGFASNLILASQKGATFFRSCVDFSADSATSFRFEDVVVRQLARSACVLPRWNPPAGSSHAYWDSRITKAATVFWDFRGRVDCLADSATSFRFENVKVARLARSVSIGIRLRK
jgi:hypothetical protein